MGAIGEGGVRILDSHIVESLRVDDRAIAAVEARERGELERRVARLRGGRAARSLSGRTAVIVDDGLATGSTARAAIAVARRYGVTRVVLAVPVAPAEAADELTGVADAVVVVATPDHFDAVGRWYVDFSPTTDDDVVRILSRSR
jgi:putative phosphoribosyl transferase